MILDSIVSGFVEVDEPTELERDINALLDKLIEAVKAGSYQEEAEELLSRFWCGTVDYYKDGMKAGIQLLHEALMK